MREELIDRMIAVYGMGHEEVIEFCKMCESYPQTGVRDWILEIIVKCHEQG